MKKSLIIILFSLSIFPLISACISYPTFEGKNCNISFLNYFNKTEVNNLLNTNIEKCIFTDDDIPILVGLISNGYSVKEQTDSEYEKFLTKAEKDNSERPSDCLDYKAVARNNTWTGYVRTGSMYSKEHGCVMAKCAGTTVNLIWNVLTRNSSCQSLYYIDDTNKNCGQKDFCGMYMYQGLETFESKAECENSVNYSQEGGPMSIHCQYITTENSCNNYGSNLCTWDTEKNYCEIKRGCENCNKSCPNGSTNENGICIKKLSNGKNAEIKIMPQTASENAIARLGELNFTIELKEVGRGDDAKVVYELSGNKEGKFLGIFKIMARVKAQIDAETGETKVIKPWWSFLATKI